MTQLSQIIYASAAEKQYSATELTEILNNAREHNDSKGISGILVYRKGSFLQVLEGPKDELDVLYARIVKDPRHSNIKLLFKGDIEEKDFEEWSMGFVDTSKEAEYLEGFLDYETEFMALTLDDSRARQVLKGFSNGTWRQAVET